MTLDPPFVLLLPDMLGPVDQKEIKSKKVFHWP